MIEVITVNVGVPRLLGQRQGVDVYSGIAKRPVDGGTVLWLSLANLAGDGQADLSVHGGPDKAIYAYPFEHLTRWEAELGEPMGAAPFGENLSTQGASETDVLIGDRWRWGGATLEVCQPRSPCFKLAMYRKRADIQSRLKSTGRTGWYLRVIEPGAIVVGSPIEVTEVDPAGLSVADAHQAMADRHLTNRGLVEALARHPALAAEWKSPLQARLDAGVLTLPS